RRRCMTTRMSPEAGQIVDQPFRSKHRSQGLLRVLSLLAVTSRAAALPPADVRYTILDVGTLGGEPRSSDAWSINEAGQVAGISRASSGERHALRYSNG